MIPRMGLPPVAFPPPHWNNQKVVLYHGTLDWYAGAIVTGPIQTSRGKTRRDFGPGFYTTTDRQQAFSWAVQLAEQQPGTAPALIELEVDREGLARLDILGFVRGDFSADDYWSFVHHCRRGATNHARPAPHAPLYDAVYGPVAAFWNQRMIVANGDQFSFHTVKAESLLNASPRRRLIDRRLIEERLPNRREEHQMEAEGTMNADLAAEFWTAVEDCLVRFHNFPPSIAKDTTHGLWKRLRHTPQPDAFRDLIYHEEPWYIACNLAGKTDAVLGPKDSPLYDAILKTHGLFPKADNASMTIGN